MDTGARLTTTATGRHQSTLDPDAGHAASAAAHYVTQTRPRKQKGEGGQVNAGFRRSLSQRDDKRSSGYYDLASAGAAASLAHSSQKSRRPRDTQHDTRRHGRHISVDEIRFSTAGSKAAFFSIRDTPDIGAGPKETDESLVAAKKGFSWNPEEESWVEEDDPRAKLAASGAMSTSRKRAESTSSMVDGFPDLTPAMSAATTSHKAIREEEPPSETIDQKMDTGKLHSLAVASSQRDLYTSHPPVDIEVEDQRKKDTLHAAAISMAQQLYAVTPKAEQMAAADISNLGPDQGRLPTIEEPERPATQPPNLQAAAEKRALDRIAAMERDQRYSRGHYSAAASPRPHSYMSNRLRKRSASDADTTQRRHRKTYSDSETTSFVGVSQTEGGDTVLMAAAHKNVNTMMNNIDQRIYMYSGKPSPAVMNNWQRIADERAASDAQSRTAVEQETAQEQHDVDEVARLRIQPTLKDIDDRVNERRARQVEKHLDTEHNKRQSKLQKQREKDTVKAHNKIKKLVLKKATDKVSKAEKKRQKKEGKGKGKSKASEVETALAAQQHQGMASRETQEDLSGLDGVEEDQHSPPRSHIERERAGEPSSSPISRNQTEESSLSRRSEEGEGVERPVTPVERRAVTQETKTTQEGPKRRMSIRRTWFRSSKRDHAEDLQEAPQEQQIKEKKQVKKTKKTKKTKKIKTEEQQEPPVASEPTEQPRPITSSTMESEQAIASRQWSTSNEGEPTDEDRDRAVAEQQPQETGIERPVSSQASGPKTKRFSLTQMFRRSSRRDASGKQGSFNVERRTTSTATWDAEDVQNGNVATRPQLQSQGGSQIATDRGSVGGKNSKFQENL